ncbi:MAG: ABC transporter ATP-binding protein, partial [Chlamydiota bacterium]|nr:ABC transporter ATP-binding protein [Chlamydiota bacterium]
MPEIAISIRDLGKRYYIGTQGNLLQTFRESLSEIPQWFRKKTKSAVKNILDTSSSNASDIDPETPEGSFWALRDINFDVQQGDVVGIIGRNGAGKTTLLKILSKITQPTKGMVTLHGRAASLLEVGTGFHSELTGRENIFLNGAILGMKRSEIKSKFDEIVEFSEVEKFLDTPVKHYSSGMRVRLAFAVAAHLEAEILLVDEVLAVGDAAFQKKCLGKMGEVSKQGRTVLFVSHNMAAVENLCQKGVLLEKGKISSIGTIGESVSKYMSSMNNDVYDLSQRTDRLGTGQIRLTQIDIRDDDNNRVEFVKSGQNINIYLHFRKNTSE